MDAFLQEAESGVIELCMSWMNIAETFYILAKRGSPAVAEAFLTRLSSMPLRTVVPGEAGIMAAARIKAAHRVAFAISLAQAEQASVITGDDEIRRCAVVPVDWIGTQGLA